MKFLCSNCKGIVSLDFEAEMVNCGFCDSLCQVPPPMSSGVIIDDFMIIRKLGSGGMGDVYLAHEFSLDRDIALKILKESIAQNEEQKNNFVREARAVASLNHPNIIQAYKVGDDEGLTFFAMECAEGKTLQQILGEYGVLDEIEALEIANDIVDALGYAWEKRQLVHRDIKPENIMVTNEGMTKLMDLGLSVPASEVDNNSKMISGTPQYISPEQILGYDLDIRSDFYCLGATLYHLLSGDFPFDGNLQEMIRKHIQEPPKSLKKMRPELSGHTVKIVHNLMNKDVDNRYSSTAKLTKDIQYSITCLTNTRKTKKTINIQQKSGRKLEQVSKRKSGIDPAKAAIAAMVILLIIAFGLVKLFTGGSGTSEKVPEVKPKITYKGKVKKRSTPFLGETLERGLNYAYYEKRIDPKKLHELEPIATGHVPNPDISVKGNTNYSGYIFSGFLKIDKSSPYHFYLKANDYCKIEINGKEVMAHDNQREEKIATVELDKGYAPIKIFYYQKTSDKWLNIFIESPSFSRQTLPEAMLFRKPDRTKEDLVKTKEKPDRKEEKAASENVPCFPFNSEWKYYCAAENPGSDWYTADYNDSNWAKGKGSFGYGKKPVTNFETVKMRNISFYLRKKILLRDINSTFKFNCKYDDGFALFINGKEAGRENVKDISHESTAETRINGPDKTSITLPREYLKDGENLIAVIVKNKSLRSSDIHFDAELVTDNKPEEISVNSGDLFFARMQVPEETQKPALLAYEAFSYKENLPDMDGGLGWTGTWTGGQILINSLATSMEKLESIQCSGNQLYLHNSKCSRTFDTGPESTFAKNGFLTKSNMIGKRNTSLYISFFFKAEKNSPFEILFSKKDKGFAFGIGKLKNDTNLHLLIGSGKDNPFSRLNKQGQLIVIKIDYKKGDDDVYVLRNPTPGKAIPKWPKSPIAKDLSFNHLSINATDSTFWIDEIRIGTTYESVTPIK